MSPGRDLRQLETGKQPGRSAEYDEHGVRKASHNVGSVQDQLHPGPGVEVKNVIRYRTWRAR